LFGGLDAFNPSAAAAAAAGGGSSFKLGIGFSLGTGLGYAAANQVMKLPEGLVPGVPGGLGFSGLASRQDSGEIDPDTAAAAMAATLMAAVDPESKTVQRLATQHLLPGSQARLQQQTAITPMFRLPPLKLENSSPSAAAATGGDSDAGLDEFDAALCALWDSETSEGGGGGG
jgi:hypothetical protein